MSLCADWTTGADILAMAGPDTTITEATADLAATLASSILYELTGRRWNGLCEQTIRPCARRRGYQGTTGGAGGNGGDGRVWIWCS